MKIRATKACTSPPQKIILAITAASLVSSCGLVPAQCEAEAPDKITIDYVATQNVDRWLPRHALGPDSQDNAKAMLAQGCCTLKEVRNQSWSDRFLEPRSYQIMYEFFAVVPGGTENGIGSDPEIQLETTISADVNACGKFIYRRAESHRKGQIS